MSGTPSSKAINILRWIVIFPGALLGAWLTWIIFDFVLKLTTHMFLLYQYEPESFYSRTIAFITDIISHGVLGAMFVYLGAKIAPTHRKVVAYVLAGLSFLIVGFSLYPAIIIRDMLAIGGAIAVVISVGVVAYEIHHNKILL